MLRLELLLSLHFNTFIGLFSVFLHFLVCIVSAQATFYPRP